MNILLLGSGGREHALAWKLCQSDKCGALYIAPGNAGTANCGTNVKLDNSDFPAIKAFVQKNDIGMLVVGPEQPLVDGIYDWFKADADCSQLPVIGPSKAGALLEGSKSYAKELMSKYNVPTAGYIEVSVKNLDAGMEFIEQGSTPVVLKADGLAGGKGVLILDSKTEAKTELRNMIDGKFGAASNTVVIEEFMHGIECSVFVATDGDSYKILPSCKDYKRIGEGDTGLNTGGMGVVAPVPFADEAFMKKVENQTVIPMIEGMKADGIIYKGILYCGFMNVNGQPKVVEFNCRFGDPECEVLMPMIESDLVDMFTAIAEGTLHNYELKTSDKSFSTVMLVSGGYPESYAKGKTISGLEHVGDAIPFHAGTTLNDKNEVITSGGRVLTITASGNNLKEALAISNKYAAIIDFEGKNYRKDIGYDVLKN